MVYSACLRSGDEQEEARNCYFHAAGYLLHWSRFGEKTRRDCHVDRPPFPSAGMVRSMHHSVFCVFEFSTVESYTNGFEMFMVSDPLKRHRYILTVIFYIHLHQKRIFEYQLQKFARKTSSNKIKIKKFHQYVLRFKNGEPIQSLQFCYDTR